MHKNPGICFYNYETLLLRMQGLKDFLHSTWVQNSISMALYERVEAGFVVQSDIGTLVEARNVLVISTESVPEVEM